MPPREVSIYRFLKDVRCPRAGVEVSSEEEALYSHLGSSENRFCFAFGKLMPR
jgi:hypothetical protein